MVQLTNLLMGVLALNLPLATAKPIALPQDEPTLQERSGPVCMNVEIPVTISAANQVCSLQSCSDSSEH